MGFMRRLEALERQLLPDDTEDVGVVGIYDPQTGQQLTPTPRGATVVILLPDNGRGGNDGQSKLVAATGSK